MASRSWSRLSRRAGISVWQRWISDSAGSSGFTGSSRYESSKFLRSYSYCSSRLGQQQIPRHRLKEGSCSCTGVGHWRDTEVQSRPRMTHPLWRERCPSQHRCFSSGQDKDGKETISVTFIDKDGTEKVIQVPMGESMLEAAHENDIDLEGACEGSLACSTCHVIIVDQEYYDKMPEPSDEENDMLDLAFGLTETSRLGCQVIAKKELDGLRLALPAATRNFAVDGHKPKPH